MMTLRKDNDSPGPGQYNPDAIKTKKKDPQFGFGTETKMRTLSKTNGPDPSSYTVKDDLMRKTASSWGMGYGTKINLSKTLADTPGPGSYQFRSTITDGKKVGMGKRRNLFKL